jgi:hypothetical protein
MASMDEHDTDGVERARSRTIKHLPGTDIIEVRYAGAISYAYRIGTLEALERISPAGGVRRLLINYTSAWPISEPEPEAAAEFGARMGRLALAKDARVALVNAPPSVDAQTDAVLTQGGFLFRQFHDRAQAIGWLEAELPL